MQARELLIHKAETTGAPVAGVTIHIHEPVPDLWHAGRIHDSLDAYVQFYDEQAQQLADALMAALPGGTLDRLLAKLLTAKASHFRVPWPHTKRNEPEA